MIYEEVVKKWREYPIVDKGDIDMKLHNFRIIFAYNSGKIENEKINFHDTREIFENGKISAYTGDVRTLFEQQNQKDCYELLMDKIVNKAPITVELIKKIHFELNKGTYDEMRFAKGERPGEFKKHDYIVGFYNAGSNVEDVEKDLVELINETDDYHGENILKAAAYFHARFEQIHPFADGNGRVGRTLMNYYLMINTHPPIIIFEEDKKEYFQALESFDADENLSQLHSFLIRQLEKTWKDYKGKRF